MSDIEKGKIKNSAQNSNRNDEILNTIMLVPSNSTLVQVLTLLTNITVFLTS